MTQSLQQILNKELSERVRRNPSYSMRAFAGALGVSPAYLSRLMAGKRGASREFIRRVAKIIGLSDEQRSRLETNAPQSLDGVVPDQDIDRFYGDWVGMALLELMTLDDFLPQESWVAQRLGVSIARIRSQLAMLVNLGLVEVTADEWKNVMGDVSVVRVQATSSARKNLLCQRLSLARDAVVKFDFDSRDHSFVTLAMDERLMQEARDILKHCRRKLLQLGQKSREKSMIYHLDLAFYPVTCVSTKHHPPSIKVSDQQGELP